MSPDRVPSRRRPAVRLQVTTEPKLNGNGNHEPTPLGILESIDLFRACEQPTRRVEKSKIDRTNLAIIALLSIDDTGKYFRNKSYSQVALSTYPDLLPDSMPKDKRQKKLRSLNGSVWNIRKNLIEVLVDLNSDILNTEQKDKALARLGQIRATHPFYRYLSAEQAISLLKLERSALLPLDILNTPRSLKGKYETWLRPLPDIAKPCMLALTQLTPEGKLAYAGSRDPELAKKVFENSQQLPESGKSLTTKLNRISAVRDTFVRRLDRVKSGKEDKPVSEILEEIRLSHPNYEKLNIDDLIKLLNRKSPRKKPISAAWRASNSIFYEGAGSKPAKATGDQEKSGLLPTAFEMQFDLPFTQADSLPISLTVYRQSHPPSKPPVIIGDTKEAMGEITVEAKYIPYPEIPTSKFDIKDYLPYFLMLIDSSGEKYMFEDVSKIQDFNYRYLKRNTKYIFRDVGLIPNPQAYITDFISKLREFDQQRQRDPDHDIKPKVTSPIGIFLRWAEREPLYEFLTVSDLIAILERKITCQQVIEDYMEFMEIEKDIPKPVKTPPKKTAVSPE